MREASQVALVVKNLPANAGDRRDAGLTPGLGRSPGGRHGNPLQYCCLENHLNRGAQQAIVHNTRSKGKPKQTLEKLVDQEKLSLLDLFQ